MKARAARYCIVMIALMMRTMIVHGSEGDESTNLARLLADVSAEFAKLESQSIRPAAGFIKYDYLVPGVFLLATQSHPSGTAAACGMDAPSAEPMWRSLTSQAVTPITERQTIYYYSGCLSRGYATEEQSRDQIAVFEKAFAEDKAMIEAQQRIVAGTPERRMMVLATDGALNQFRRLMAGLIEAEQASLSGPGERRFA